MAGSPIRNQQMNDLLARLDELEDLLRQGKSDREAMAEIGINCGALYRLESKNEHAKERIALARKDGAKAMMSDTVDIADAAELNLLADPVRVAQLRINVRQQLASKRDREGFGEQSKVAVQVNVNTLHLTALQHAQALRHDNGRQLPAPDIVDGELVEPDNLNDIL